MNKERAISLGISFVTTLGGSAYVAHGMYSNNLVETGVGSAFVVAGLTLVGLNLKEEFKPIHIPEDLERAFLEDVQSTKDISERIQGLIADPQAIGNGVRISIDNEGHSIEIVKMPQEE